MSRLPEPGSDQGTWGQILNDFLLQAHDADGSLKSGAITKNTVGLSNVDNTADVSKPISTATQVALDGKLPKDSYWIDVSQAPGIAYDGTTDDSAAFQVLLDSIPSAGGSEIGGACLFFPKGVMLLNTATSGVVANLSGKINVMFIGVGGGSRIRTTTTIATELLRIDGCQHFRMKEMLIQIQGTASIDKALHITSPSPGSVHNVHVENLIITSNASYRKAYDIASVSGSPTIWSAQALFTNTDVGGVITLDQTTGPFYSTIQSTTQASGTLAGSMDTVTTTLTLNSPLSGTPSSGFTVKVGNERMLVTAGGATTTLTVTRARGVDRTTEAHTTGDTVTTSSATLADNLPVTVSNATTSARIQPGGQPVMKSGLCIANDHPGTSNLDVAGCSYRGVTIQGAAYAGLEIGNGTSGNTLEHWGSDLTLSTCAYGFLMNFAAFSAHHVNFSTNLVDIYRWGVSSSPVVISTVRSEGPARFYDMLGGATSGQSTTITGIELVTFNADDGVPFRHVNSGAVLLQNWRINSSNVTQGTILFSVAGSSSNPCHFTAINVAHSGGGGDIFSSVTRPTCIKTIITVPRTGVSGVGVTANTVVGMDLDQRLRLGAGFVRARATVADTNRTVTIDDSLVAYTSLTVARVVTLPAQGSTLPSGQEFTIKDESGSCDGVKTITIQPVSGTIDGVASVVLNAAYAKVSVYTNGTNWFTR
jgi:hypothetical protein